MMHFSWEDSISWTEQVFLTVLLTLFDSYSWCILLEWVL